MEFTFGIITNNGNLLDKMIESIYAMDIPKDKYEIIIVGSCDIKYTDNIIKVAFDESIKSMWITKKKNLITLHSTKENIVYMHDYIGFDKDWYSGFLRFGNDWDVCSTPQYNQNGTRFRDWVLHECHFDNFEFKGSDRLIPYDNEAANYIYINGTYWVAKKQAMIEAPLDEDLGWGQSEDIAWSKYIKWKRYKIKINTYSTVNLLRQKDVVFTEMKSDFYENKFKPFIMDTERNNRYFENNQVLYENTCSFLTKFIRGNFKQKYLGL